MMRGACLVVVASVLACAEPARPTPTTPTTTTTPATTPVETATTAATAPPAPATVPIDWRRCAAFPAFATKKELPAEAQERLHSERTLFDCSSAPTIRIVSQLPLETLYSLVASCPVSGPTKPHVIHNDHDVFLVASTHVREEGMAIVTRLAQNPKIDRIDVLCQTSQPRPN